METEKTQRIVARCSRSLKSAVAKAEAVSGQGEGAIVRSAVRLFLAEHKTANQINSAIVRALCLKSP